MPTPLGEGQTDIPIIRHNQGEVLRSESVFISFQNIPHSFSESIICQIVLGVVTMQPNENAVDKTRVFVVHGRNEELRKSMFDFLRSIGLKPIEWSQAIQMTGNASPFIGDVLDAAFKQAQAVVVLLTGDDEARLHPEYHTDKMPDYEKNLTSQARPNVIFEAGLALGRFPKRTIIIEVGDLRPFSDIAGRHTVRLNNSTRTRQDVAQRLATAGCKVDLSGTDWHQSGNFDIKNSSKNKSSPEDKPALAGHKKDKGISEGFVTLPDAQVKILVYLANQTLATEDDIQENTKIGKGVLTPLLEELVEIGYVEEINYSDYDNQEDGSEEDDESLSNDYFISKLGAKYLVSIGKI